MSDDASSPPTTVTDLITHGVPLEDVQHLLGQADPSTTRLYDRTKRHVTRNTVQRVSILSGTGRRDAKHLIRNRIVDLNTAGFLSDYFRDEVVADAEDLDVAAREGYHRFESQAEWATKSIRFPTPIARPAGVRNGMGHPARIWVG